LASPETSAVGLLDVGGPPLVVSGGVDRQADDLHAALVELRLDLGHVAELGGADRGEVLGVGEQDPPGFAEPVVEADRPFARLRLEVRSGIANGQWHGLPPLVTADRAEHGCVLRVIYDMIGR
jgi:hypothetical protein